MPNHVTNKLKLFGEQSRIDELLRAVKYDDDELGTLDFNKIVPMPECLNMTSGSIEHSSVDAYLSAVNPHNKGFEQVEKMDKETFEKIVSAINSYHYVSKCKTNLNAKEIADELEKYSDIGDVMSFVELGKKYVDNLQNYGATTWYNFCINNWGSKWNSYDYDELYDNTLTYHTAWSRVMPIITKLAQMYPDIRMEYQWADEDIGSNVGRADFENGELVEEYIPEPQSKEAYELAAEIHDFELRDFGYVLSENTQNYEYHNEDEIEEMGME